jgi:hypothetical protein
LALAPPRLASSAPRTRAGVLEIKMNLGRIEECDIFITIEPDSLNIILHVTDEPDIGRHFIRWRRQRRVCEPGRHPFSSGDVSTVSAVSVVSAVYVS